MREFTKPESKFEISTGNESYPPIIGDRIVDVLLVNGQEMSLDEIFKAVVNDGYKKISKLSLDMGIRTPLQSGIIRRIRHGYYIHTDFCLKGSAEKLCYTTQERLIDVFKATPSVMSVGQIKVAISKDGLVPMPDGTLKSRLHSMTAEGIIKRLGCGYYIHADFYIEGMEASFQPVRRSSLTTSERQTQQRNSKVSRSTDKKESQLTQLSKPELPDKISQHKKPSRSQHELLASDESYSPIIGDRVINVLLASGQEMSLDEIFKAIINDGYKKILKNSLSESIRAHIRSGIIKRIRYGYYIHADFYLEGRAEKLYYTAQERLIDVLKTTPSVMSVGQIKVAISQDGLAPMPYGTLKMRLRLMTNEGIIKCLGRGYYIHADFYLEGMEASFQSIKSSNPTTFERQTRQRNSKVSKRSTNKNNSNYLRDQSDPLESPLTEFDVMADEPQSLPSKTRAKPLVLRRTDQIIEEFECQIDLQKLIEELRKEGYGELLDSETFINQAEARIKRKQMARARKRGTK